MRVRIDRRKQRPAKAVGQCDLFAAVAEISVIDARHKQAVTVILPHDVDVAISFSKCGFVAHNDNTLARPK